MQLSFFSKQEKTKPVLAGFLLKEQQGTCFLYEKNERGVSLLRQSVFQYSDGWNRITEDMNDVLSPLEAETKTYSTEVIYYVFSHVIDQSSKEIKKPYAGIIKQASHALELKPIGYIEVIDGVRQFLQKDKEGPLSALIIELDASCGTIFLYKAGHCVSRVEVGRTDSIMADISEGLREIRQTHPVLPSVMYLYDSSDLSKESSELVSHKWDSELFAQQPRVEVISQQAVSDSLRTLFASQIHQEQTTEPRLSQKAEATKSVMGFSIGSDVFAERPLSQNNESSQSDTKKKTAQPSTSGNTVFSKMKSLVRSGPRFTLPAKKGLLMLGVFLITLLLVIGIFELVFHRAEVTIYPVKKSITQSFNEAVPISDQVGESLSAVQKEVSKTYTVQAVTTGKKDIGERSSGSVTLYSYDEKEKSFAKGYVLRVEDIEYELDDQLSVPPSSFAGDGITKNPGKIKTTVRAINIGSQANKSKGQKFSLDGVSSSVYFAIADEDISGGTKKTIQTVSKEDIELLTKQITTKAKGDLSVGENGDTDRGLKAVEGVSEVALSGLKPSAEIGEEASKVSLTASATLVGFFMDSGKLNAFIKDAIVDKVESGYTVSSIKADRLSGKKEDKALRVKFTAQVETAQYINIKQIQEAAMWKTVRGFEENFLSRYPSSRIEVKLNPGLMPLGLYMPFLQSHVDVRINNK